MVGAMTAPDQPKAAWRLPAPARQALAATFGIGLLGLQRFQSTRGAVAEQLRGYGLAGPADGVETVGGLLQIVTKRLVRAATAAPKT